MRVVLRLLGALELLVVIAIGALATAYLSWREPIVGLNEDRSETVVDGERIHALGPALKAANERLTQLRREIQYPSVSAAVAVDGKIFWVEAQGYADLARGIRATPNTIYPVGSVSKPLTAAVVMRLADRGLIDIDKDVRAYIPWFPQKAHPFTARQLMSHQAGIRHYKFELTPPTFSEFGSTIQYPSVRDSMRVFAGDPLLFEPDTSFAYSSHGYTVLAAVIESATGRPFLDAMHTELFEPLGMARSGGDDKLHPAAGRASDYQNPARDGHVVAAPFTNSSGKWAGGGLRATPIDLAMFGIALLEGHIVTPEKLTAMFTPRTTKDGKVNPQDYGLGFRIDTISDPAYPGRAWRAVHHGGVAVGSQAMLVLLPDHQIVVALATNAATQPPGRGMFDAATDLAVLFAQTRAQAQSASK